MTDYKIKQVYFNVKRDAELLTVVKKIDNFSDWVKQCIRKEQNESVDIEAIVNKIIESRIGTITNFNINQDIIKESKPAINEQKFCFDGFI